MKKVIVVGGGPAGLISAIFAAKKGAKVSLLEKMDRPAKKLLITGKGRCNLTNTAEFQDFIENIPGNGAFLYSSLSKFDNTNLIEFFEELGVILKIERGGRVFPESDRAKDVADALIDCARKNGVNIVCNSHCHKIISEGGFVKGIKLNDGKVYQCDSLIIATGGMSYPRTGSTGDGYRMAKEAGHTIVSPKPSLVPMNVKEKWMVELQGLSLKNSAIKIFDSSKRLLYEDFGEMLFTHFGVSGPIIISASRHLLDIFYNKTGSREARLIIDFKPALSQEKLDERIQRDFKKYSNRQYKNSLDDLLPSKLIPVIIKLSEINPEKSINQVSKAERKKLGELLKNFELTLTGFRPIEEAIITAGGVSTNEINPSTMESKKLKRLYFAGEIINVDGYTGGFNLQIAFSTGCAAGVNSV